MGPLHGVRVVEMAGIGPAPFCGMLLADMGAEVLRVERTEPADLGMDPGSDPRFHVLSRGKRIVALDLKSAPGREAVLALMGRADVLIEGFRPGTMERLGLGPDAGLAANPRLIYGRMTGWGQEGPAAPMAGHDINYIALAGALHGMGAAGSSPMPPLNLVGDFGGGAMFLAFGIACALVETAHSGKGQVIDAAMVDGAAYLMTGLFGMLARGMWSAERGCNFLDGSAPWYSTYETADGKFVAVGAIEARFYAQLLQKTALDGEALPAQGDRAGWPLLRSRLSAVFRTKTRAAWSEIFSAGDACVTPVLSMAEAPDHPHSVSRGSFIDVAGVRQPAPAPRFSRTAVAMPEPAPHGASDLAAVLADWGLSDRRLFAGQHAKAPISSTAP